MRLLRHITAEALLNWIEVQRVWWQEEKNTTATLNYLSKCTRLVDCTVVENQDAFVLRVGVHLWQLAEGRGFSKDPKLLCPWAYLVGTCL